VDRKFVDSQPEITTEWLLKDSKGILKARVPANKNLALSDSKNYAYDCPVIYKRDFATLDFFMHDGWRKVTWTLRPCDSDVDGDYICDDFDENGYPAHPNVFGL
jgi:hypothetical protein